MYLKLRHKDSGQNVGGEDYTGAGDPCSQVQLDPELDGIQHSGLLARGMQEDSEVRLITLSMLLRTVKYYARGRTLLSQ